MSAPLRRRELAVLLVLFSVAAPLRLFGVDWDDGHHLHPDERFLTMVATDVRLPSSIGEYFDTSRSRLNPANVGQSYFTYGTLPLFVVRAAADAVGLNDYDRIPLVGRVLASSFDLATLLFAWLIARRLAGPRAGLFAAALLACSVISIQQAHFFTVDSFAACFATAALLMLVEISLGANLWAHAGFGVAIGLMLACRINLLVLASAYPIALVVLRMRGGSVRRLAAGTVLAIAAAAVAFRIFQPYAFAGSFWSVPTLAPAFVQSMRTILAFSTGAADFPPSVQWIGRVPVLYPGSNLFIWGLGPAWGVAAIVATAWSILSRPDVDERRERTAARLIVLWAGVLFFFQAMQFVATLRYFLPVVPALAILTGCWLASMRGRAQAAVAATVLLLTAGWAVSFTSIYRHPHTRVSASAWIYDTLPPGATIATEHWDDALPLALAGRTADRYDRVELALYEEENTAKRDGLIGALDKADAIVLSSNRLYRSIPRAPWRYPLARRYYELLFAGQLGFRLDRVFASYPRLGSLEVNDDGAEEAFSVYDHPKVLVFRKTSTYSHDLVATQLGAVSLGQLNAATPRAASALFRQMRPTEVPLPGERSVRSPLPTGATDSVEATIRWLVSFEALALAIWILGVRWWSPVWPDSGYGLSKMLAWLVPGTLVWLLASYGVADVGVGTARAVAGTIIAIAAFVGWRNRASLQQLISGSAGRTMLAAEAVFLGGFAVGLGVRAWTPAVAWGEKPMDFAILNAILRSPAVPPADPWYAGESLNYFYFGHFVTAVTSQISGVPPEIAFNLAIATVAGLLAVAGLIAARQLSGRLDVGVITASALLLMGNFAGPRLFFSTPADRRGFDYFWATSRVIPGTINEYPPWSLAFADLHAHVLAMPLELTLLALGLTWCTNASVRSAIPRLSLVAVTAWVLGALAITSSWSALTATAAQLLFLLTAWRRPGAGLRDVLRAIAAWIAVVGGALILFLPFWSRYLAPTGNWGYVRTEAALIIDVLTIFGPLLILGAPALLVRQFRNGSGVRRIVLFVAFIALAGSAALVRSPACGLFTAMALVGFAGWLLDEDPSVRTAAACFALAGGIGIMTETVYLWDRMNTVFKFYLQMWLLLTPAAVALASLALRGTSGLLRLGVATAFCLTGAAALFTTTTGVAGLLREPRVPGPHPTLDGLAYLRDRSAGELEAYTWINQNVRGIPVVLEAHGDSYQDFSRVAMNTGLPTVLGWKYHLFQQGRPQDQIDARAEDVRELYDTTDLDRARQLLAHYHVDLVVVGPLERRTYKHEGLAKFASWDTLQPVFSNASVSIYATRAVSATVRTSVRPITRSVALGRLREPRGIARAADGGFAVADFGNRRIVLADAAGTPRFQFGHEGDAPAEFRDPCAVVFDDDGTLVVADTWNHRIQRLSRGGQMLSEWRHDLYGPRGIARADDGSFYVTDTGHDRIVRFASNGTATEVVAPGVLDNPVGIVVSAEREIFVADTGHSRIAVFSADGTLVRTWPIDGWSVKAGVEPQLALGPDHVLWVTDPPAGRVLLFGKDGQQLGVADAVAPLGSPTGIAIIDRTTAMVSDARENRLIQVRRPPSPSDARQPPRSGQRP